MSEKRISKPKGRYNWDSQAFILGLFDYADLREVHEWRQLFCGKTLPEAEDEKRIGVTALYGMIQDNMPDKAAINPIGTRPSVCVESLRGKLGSRAKGRETHTLCDFTCAVFAKIYG